MMLLISTLDKTFRFDDFLTRYQRRSGIVWIRRTYAIMRHESQRNSIDQARPARIW